MEQLKARGVDDVYIEYYNTGKHELAQVYLKSEADKVLLHKDRKRCLAMADYAEMSEHYNNAVGNGFWLVHGDKETRDKHRSIAERWSRWRSRWLSLADEPTWAKFLQLIHKEAK